MAATSKTNTIKDQTIDGVIKDTDLPPGLLRRKINAEIAIADRKQALEELKVTNSIAMEKRLQDFKEAESLRLAESMERRSDENWMKSYWRPAMGWIYATICLFDFVIAPIMFALLPAFVKGVAYKPWTSLTLENGGLIHLSFAAILGVTAWTRGQEGIIKTRAVIKAEEKIQKKSQSE